MSDHIPFKPPELLERRRLYSGKIVELVVDSVRIDEAVFLREVVRHPGGVVVLARLPDGRIPFVRQLRYPMQQELLELPAGKLDPEEDPAQAAARELEEETGLQSEVLQHVFSFYPTPGFCDEFLHLYYTNQTSRGCPDLEPDEQLRVEYFSLSEALEMATNGEIRDGKTILGLLWLQLNLQQSRPQEQ